MYWYGAVNGRIFYKSDSEIMEETCLSESELRTAKNKLKSMSFIDIKAKGVPARTHYFINPQELISQIRNFSSAKSTKLKTRNQQNYNSEFNETITENTTENTTKTKSDIYSENEFSHTEDEIKNPFTRQGFSDSLDADKVKKKEKMREKKEKAEPKQPSDIFVAYEMFCTFHESVSAAKYPRTLNGNYILNPIDARNVKLLLEWVEKINPDNKMDNFKVFVQAAWMLDDKYLKANFNIGLLYRQCTQIYAKVQNSNPILSKQKKEEQLNAEAAEFLRSRYGIVN
jgi:DNA-binding transcriptional regulator GbsR (MarR family)